MFTAHSLLYLIETGTRHSPKPFPSDFCTDLLLSILINIHFLLGTGLAITLGECLHTVLLLNVYFL